MGSLFRVFSRALPHIIKTGSKIVKKVAPIASRAIKSKAGKQVRKKVLKAAINSSVDLLNGKSPKSNGANLKRDLVKIAQNELNRRGTKRKRQVSAKKTAKPRKKKCRGLFANK